MRPAAPVAGRIRPVAELPRQPGDGGRLGARREGGLYDEIQVARAGDCRWTEEVGARSGSEQRAAASGPSELDERQPRRWPSLHDDEAAAVEDHAVAAGQRDT